MGKIIERPLVLMSFLVAALGIAAIGLWGKARIGTNSQATVPARPNPTGPGSGHAEPARVAPVGSVSELGETSIWNADPKKRFIAKVSQTKPDDDAGWPEDWFKFQLLADDRRILVSQKFISSYGIFRIDLIDLTGDGQEEIIFVTGMGRGTSVRGEGLEILKWRGNALTTILETPLSGYFDDGCRWWYAIEYLDLNDDGITDLRMVLTHDQIKWHDFDWGGPTDIPATAIKEFHWDAKTQKMFLFREVPRKAIRPPAGHGSSP